MEPTPSDSPAPATAEPERSLEHSVRDGCAHAVMLGAGEAYLSPFAISRGATSVHLGVLASLPLLVGSLIQLVAAGLLDRHVRRKPLVVVPALLQSFSWLPLFALPALVPDHAPALVVLGAALYFATGHFALPVWNSWMGDLVAPERRGDYFGRRDRLRTIWQVVALVGAGAVLGGAEYLDYELAGFAAIFGVAILARVVSVVELARMKEPEFVPPARHEVLSIREFVRALPRSNFGRFALYVASMQFATNLAGPFFALYMLRDLGFSYIEFTAASAVCILAQAFTFHNWGRVGDQYGNLAVLRITGICLPVVPLLWLISPRFEAVLIYQIVSGVAWAGYNLAAATYIFDAVPPAQRARCVAYYHVLVNSGIFAGALTGGALAPHLPRVIGAAGFELEFISNLPALFLLSGFARLVSTLGFMPFLRRARVIECPAAWRVFVRVIGVQPIRGLRFSIFNGVHPADRAAPPERADPDERSGDTA